jgi:hypothetical protein
MPANEFPLRYWLWLEEPLPLSVTLHHQEPQFNPIQSVSPADPLIHKSVISLEK